MNSNESNLLKAFAEFKWPEPAPVFFRLYHNDDGTPRMYSMEDHPGKYIEVDAKTFALGSFNVRVIDQKLVHVQPPTLIHKLAPADTGMPCDPRDVCVIVDQKQTHIKWKITKNEIN
jgi:hypothetical protein